MTNLFYKKKEKKIKNKRFKEIAPTLNYTINKNQLLSNLIKSGNHMGHSIVKSNVQTFPYLIGVRSKQAIINLNITIQNLKQCFRLINLNLQQNKKVLFVLNDIKINDINIFFKTDIDNNLVNFITKPWKTNFSIEELKSYNLIIALTPKNNNILIKKANNIGIPIIALIDTNTNQAGLDYKICSNTVNSQSLFFIIYLFKNLLKNITINK